MWIPRYLMKALTLAIWREVILQIIWTESSLSSRLSIIFQTFWGFFREMKSWMIVSCSSCINLGGADKRQSWWRQRCACLCSVSLWLRQEWVHLTQTTQSGHSGYEQLYFEAFSSLDTCRIFCSRREGNLDRFLGLSQLCYWRRSTRPISDRVLWPKLLFLVWTN